MTQPKHTRRDFLKHAATGAGLAFLLPTLSVGCRTEETTPPPPVSPPAQAAEGWDLVPEILARIQPPTFPDADFDITEYDAVADGTTDCTDAFRQAVEACTAAGGGRVVVPAGTFLTGPIHLKSNVNLHVSEGATVLFDQNPSAYLPAVFSRWEGMELMNYSPLIYAFEQENIAITGGGILDGQADDTHWWMWKGRDPSEGPTQTEARNRLFEMAEQGVPVEERVFGDGDHLRPNFIQPYRCQNILIEGITIHRSPMWNVHPVLCQNVTVRGITVDTHGPNNDGCNPESCTDVLIEDCYFDTGDDCIAIKSGRNADGRRVGVASSNIIVRNCEMKDGHGGVVMGSEISGGAHHIFAENCQMDSPNLERALRIKTNSLRGGVVEHVYMRNVTVGEVSDAVVRVNFYYEEGDAGTFTPTVRHIHVQNVTCEKSQHALYLRGYAHAPITDIHLTDCRFENMAEANVIEHVEDLVLENVFINGEQAS